MYVYMYTYKYINVYTEPNIILNQKLHCVCVYDRCFAQNVKSRFLSTLISLGPEQPIKCHLFIPSQIFMKIPS